MDKQKLIEYCLSKPGATHDYKAEWQADRARVAYKLFALIGYAYGRPVISLKCEPTHAEKLRGQHKDIIPGYYLNKAHWNTIFIDGEITDELFYQLIDESYQLIVSKLPIKDQQALSA